MPLVTSPSGGNSCLCMTHTIPELERRIYTSHQITDREQMLDSQVTMSHAITTTTTGGMGSRVSPFLARRNYCQGKHDRKLICCLHLPWPWRCQTNSLLWMKRTSLYFLHDQNVQFTPYPVIRPPNQQGNAPYSDTFHLSMILQAEPLIVQSSHQISPWSSLFLVHSLSEIPSSEKLNLKWL